MEKLLVILAAVLMMLSFSMVGFAQDQHTVGTTTGTGQTEMKTGHQVMIYTGEITAVNESGQNIVVKGKEGEKTFDVSKATMKGLPETHHVVTVHYMETNGKMVASSVTTVHQKVSKSMKQLSEKHAS